MRRSTSTLHFCVNPRAAAAMSSTCSGTSTSVSTPRMLAPSNGSSKPSLSRANHCGPLIAQKMSRMIAKEAATGSRPLRQRAMNNASSR